MNEFIHALNRLGDAMTDCQFGEGKPCDGIQYRRNEGIIPRCLFFDENDCTGTERITIVVGLNPGEAKTKEKNALKGVKTYEAAMAYFKKDYYNDVFYSRSKTLLTETGLNGPILWTEVAKCQGKFITKETMAFCASHYLMKEVSLAQKHFDEVVIIALAKGVYDPLIFLLPNSKVMGVPHPTSSRGQFRRLFMDTFQTLTESTKSEMHAFLNSDRQHQYFTA
jgi:hypothetical protein